MMLGTPAPRLNMGFGFGQIAKRFKGREQRRHPSRGKYNLAKRGQVDTAGHKAPPLRFWTPDQWQAWCKAVPRGKR